MNSTDDEKLAKLLRSQESEYISDDGFTGRVLQSLPAVSSRRSLARRRLILIFSSVLAGLLWVVFAYPSFAAAGQVFVASSLDIANDDASGFGWQLAAGLSTGLATLCFVVWVRRYTRQLRQHF